MATKNLKTKPSPALHTWIEEAAPLPAFRVWPLGLYKFLEPLTRENPYTDALEMVEVLEEGALHGALEKLLFDEEARSAQRARQSAYCDEVRKLPSAGELFEGYLAS